MPRRRWLYGRHIIRKFVSTTLAPGGVGKSALLLAEALAMITGRAILGITPDEGPLRVWLWNGEDPLEETERRVLAAAMHHGVSRTDLEGRLFVGSGREADLVVATQTRDGTEIAEPNVAALKALVSEHKLDVLVIDPFVSSHRVPENDNGAIDKVVKEWARIADTCDVAVELVHHVRKGERGSAAETTVEDGRGAVALLAAARSARVLNVMTEPEAEKAGVERRRSHFRVTNGKANLAPPPDGSTWYRFTSVELGNGDGLHEGDSVGVVTSWQWPDHAAGLRAEDCLAVQRAIGGGEWRADAQCDAWAGHAVARALDLDATTKGGRARIASLLRMWLTSGALKTEERKDRTRRERKFVVVGEWVSLTEEVVD